MKFYFLLCCTFFVIASASAQNRPVCGTNEETVDRNEYYLNSLFEKEIVQQKNYNGVEWIPIQIHILVRNDGSGATNLPQLQWELDTLNARFGRGNMQFYQCAPINYIKNSALYDSSYSSGKPHSCSSTSPEYILANANNIANVVNIYLIDSSNTSHAHFPSDLTNKCADWIILNKAQMQWYGVLAHEMGHYLNLFHTFNGARKAAEREHITRSTTNSCYNCTTVGDMLCDTQADPDTLNSGSWTRPGCVFTMTTRDSLCGLGSFTPWSENIMSYSTTCSHFFTAGQFTRMSASLASSDRNYLDCGRLTDCIANFTLSGNNFFYDYYQAFNNINSTQNASAKPLLVYDAGNAVILTPGFIATSVGNNVFKAFIDGCYGDRIYDRTGQNTESIPLRVDIAKSSYTIMSSIYSNLSASELFHLEVRGPDGELIYKKSFRNFSKNKGIDFYHKGRNTIMQQLKIFNSSNTLIYSKPLS